MLRVLVATFALALCLAPGCSGCAGPGVSVDLRTDLVPSREFVRVETTLAEALASDAGAAATHQTAHNVGESEDYLAGARIAEFGDLARTDYRLRVNLLDAHANVIATRLVEVTITGHTAVTVVITRNCIGVVCPPASDPTLSECVDDQCVDPRCSASAPQFCGTPTCTHDSDCHVEGCGRASCAAGVCLVAPDDAQCGLGQICWVDLSCIPAPPDGDAGASPLGDASIGSDSDDAGPGTGSEICTNQIDDDGDGLADCADSDCDHAGCDDERACTYGDHCAASACVGTAITCTASDPCAAGACDGSRQCRAGPAPSTLACGTNPEPCDGHYCDGLGRCLQQRLADGASCGAAELHCCTGHCVDVTSDATNCGACGIRCGGSCVRIPTTTFGTCACSSDSDCLVFGQYGWCSDGGRCQCSCNECPHYEAGCDSPCGGACGISTAQCADISGIDNWCYYPTM